MQRLRVIKLLFVSVVSDCEIFLERLLTGDVQGRTQNSLQVPFFEKPNPLKFQMLLIDTTPEPVLKVL
jgi:hypothetical protein